MRYALGTWLMLMTLPGFTTARAADIPAPSTVAEGAELVAVYMAEKVFFEGPSWDPKTQKLYFTAFPNDKPTQILRLDGPQRIFVWLDKTDGVNGTYLSLDGRLLGAQAYGHRVVSYAIGPEGPSDTRVLVHDKSLFQPNDIAQSITGDIYYTDPDFNKRERSAVYHLAPDGKITRIIQDMAVPNGLKVSNDGHTLYVGDSHFKNWRAYPILEDGSVGPGWVFFDPQTERRDDPDGMSIDEQGNLYLSGRGGVWVCDKFGRSLGLIPVPEFCSNVTFGGADGKTLYLTCAGKVYSLQMKVRGGQFLRVEN